MNKIVLLSVFALMFTISACQTTVATDDIKVKGDGYEVEFADGHSGKFCPPGQAKKGNC